MFRPRMVSGRYISENQEKTPEVREAAKKDWKKIKQLMKRTRKKKRSFLNDLA